MTEEAKKLQKQHPDCGEVGETGDHGDLGANAIDHPSRVKSSPAQTSTKKEPRALATVIPFITRCASVTRTLST